MQRRTFIGGSAAILAAPLCLPDALAEQPTKLPVIGYLIPTAPLIARVATAFLQGLRDAGYVEGQNVSIEYRWADGDYDRLPALAADLVARKVDVIAAVGGIAALAAKNATSTIPIVFMGVGDPVGEGLVASLARPGGNLTGFSNLFVELHPKRLELLSELLPKARVIALLVNPNTPSAEHIIRDMQEAARAKGVQLPILKASTEGEIDAAFASLGELHGGGLVVAGDAFFANRQEQLVTLASRYAIPAIYMWNDFAAAGGLISYGIDNPSMFHQAGIYAGKILQGAKPAELPVQQPTTFQLVVNLKTAKALGLTIPPSILARADEVIE
jgi:putative ABC transport system substrate-binding protein